MTCIPTLTVTLNRLVQMVRWLTWSNSSYKNPYHDDFYVQPQIKTWYKQWITTLTSRVNVITGIAYNQEPTIFAWELANEPRCGGDPSTGQYPTSPSGCTLNFAVYNVQPVVRTDCMSSAHFRAHLSVIKSAGFQDWCLGV